jgi:hypothetical protein
VVVRAPAGACCRRQAQQRQPSILTQQHLRAAARTATVGTTGTPSSREQLRRSMSRPRARARSVMFSATSIGRPRRFRPSTRRS